MHHRMGYFVVHCVAYHGVPCGASHRLGRNHGMWRGVSHGVPDVKTQRESNHGIRRRKPQHKSWSEGSPIKHRTGYRGVQHGMPHGVPRPEYIMGFLMGYHGVYHGMPHGVHQGGVYPTGCVIGMAVVQTSARSTTSQCICHGWIHLLFHHNVIHEVYDCLLYTSPSPRD